ncbi:EamA family transporter, partial [Streptomyces celluloflavus]
ARSLARARGAGGGGGPPRALPPPGGARPAPPPPPPPLHLTAHAVGGLLWLAIGSQFLGMVVWYRGMADIGVAKASQIQLAQPLLTMVWAVLLLGEHLPPTAAAAALAVLVCIAVTQRTRG